MDVRRKITKGMETLRKLETLETRKEGIFIMPLERITILASYCYVPGHTWDFGQLSPGKELHPSGSLPVKITGMAAPHVTQRLCIDPASSCCQGGSPEKHSCPHHQHCHLFAGSGNAVNAGKLEAELEHLRNRFHSQEKELQQVRLKCLPH